MEICQVTEFRPQGPWWQQGKRNTRSTLYQIQRIMENLEWWRSEKSVQLSIRMSNRKHSFQKALELFFNGKWLKHVHLKYVNWNGPINWLFYIKCMHRNACEGLAPKAMPTFHFQLRKSGVPYSAISNEGTGPAWSSSLHLTSSPKPPITFTCNFSIGKLWIAPSIT